MKQIRFYKGERSMLANVDKEGEAAKALESSGWTSTKPKGFVEAAEVAADTIASLSEKNEELTGLLADMSKANEELLKQLEEATAPAKGRK